MSEVKLGGEIVVDGRRYDIVLVPAGDSWEAVVYGDNVLVRDTGDQELNELLARAALEPREKAPR